MKNAMTLAAAGLIASTMSASAGNYSTGVQLGGAPTASQQQFHEDQMRIRYSNDHLHESEHRNGGKLVIKVTKHVWYTMRREMRRKRKEWFGPSDAQQHSGQ